MRALLLPSAGEGGDGGEVGSRAGGGSGGRSGSGGQLLSLVLNGCDAVSDALFREEEGEGGEAAEMAGDFPSDAGACTHTASSSSSLRNLPASGSGCLPLQSLSLVKCGRWQSLALGLAPKPGWSAVPLFTPKQLHLQGPRGEARPGSPSLPPLPSQQQQSQQQQPEEAEAEEMLSWCSVPTRLAGLTTLRLSLSNVQVGSSTRGDRAGASLNPRQPPLHYCLLPV